MLRDERVDVIFSSANPLTAHLVARRLHRETGLPWVAEFRDLWTDWDAPGGWRRRRDGALERALLAEATAVVTVSPTYADVLRRRGARRVAVVTNGFDPYEMPAVRPDAAPTVAYLGTYYPEGQDLRTPLAALGALVRRGELGGLRLRVIGDFTPPLAALVAECGLAAHTEALGFLPHAASLLQLARASLLLLAGPRALDRAVLAGHVAGKTFEYLGVGRPILHVGAPESDVAAFLRPFPHVRSVAPGDVDGAARRDPGARRRAERAGRAGRRSTPSRIRRSPRGWAPSSAAPAATRRPSHADRTGGDRAPDRSASTRATTASPRASASSGRTASSSTSSPGATSRSATSRRCSASPGPSSSRS